MQTKSKSDHFFIEDYQWIGIFAFLLTIYWAYRDLGMNSFGWMREVSSWGSILVYGFFVFITIYIINGFIRFINKSKWGLVGSIILAYFLILLYLSVVFAKLSSF